MALAERYQVPLAGGDTAKSPVTSHARRGQTGGLVIADILLMGSVPAGKALLRSGAHAGDILYVTGTLGGSAAELLALEQRPGAFAAAGPQGHPHLYPEPRVKTGRWLLRQRLATAAIDLSDGLSTDLTHLCEESGLAAEVYAEALPVATRASLQQALHGGEDYELLFAASRKTTFPREIGGIAVHAIGRMKKRGKGPLIELLQGVTRTPLIAGGWDHFR
jgi:thiamine-monophosphate kinase